MIALFSLAFREPHLTALTRALAALALAAVAILALTLLGAAEALAMMPSSGEGKQCYLDMNDQWVCP